MYGTALRNLSNSGVKGNIYPRYGFLFFPKTPTRGETRWLTFAAWEEVKVPGFTAGGDFKWTYITTKWLNKSGEDPKKCCDTYHPHV